MRELVEQNERLRCGRAPDEICRADREFVVEESSVIVDDDGGLAGRYVRSEYTRERGNTRGKRPRRKKVASEQIVNEAIYVASSTLQKRQALGVEALLDLHKAIVNCVDIGAAFVQICDVKSRPAAAPATRYPAAAVPLQGVRSAPEEIDGHELCARPATAAPAATANSRRVIPLAIPDLALWR